MGEGGFNGPSVRASVACARAELPHSQRGCSRANAPVPAGTRSSAADGGVYATARAAELRPNHWSAARQGAGDRLEQWRFARHDSAVGPSGADRFPYATYGTRL